MPDAPRPLPPKKEVAIALLEGPSLFVHLDPRRPGVVVPKWFMGQPQLVLQIGLNMAVKIPDLAVDDNGITCTLSFNRSPFWCHLPWTAVYALVGEDGRGMIWPNDMPPEVAAQSTNKPAAPAGKAPAKKGRSKLAAVGDERKSGKSKEKPASADGSAPPAEASRGRRGATLSAAADPPAPTEPPAAGPDAPAPARPARPRPAAVPVPALALRSEDGARGDAPARPAAPSQGPGKKPRRELPPYLRVVK